MDQHCEFQEKNDTPPKLNPDLMRHSDTFINNVLYLISRFQKGSQWLMWTYCYNYKIKDIVQTLTICLFMAFFILLSFLNSNQLRSQRLPGVYVLPAAKSPLSKYLQRNFKTGTFTSHILCKGEMSNIEQLLIHHASDVR